MKRFCETNSTFFYLEASKHGRLRPITIPSLPREAIIKTCEWLKSDINHVNAVKSYAHRHGLNTHSLRYAFITYLAKKGYDALTISKITGHKQLNHLITYLQSKRAEEVLRAEGEVLW